MIGSGLVIVSTVWEASDGRSEPTGGRGADTMEEWLGDSSGRFLDGSIHVITSWWLHWSMLLSSAERSYLRRVRPLPEHRLLVDVRGDCQPIMVIVSLKLSLILDFTTINLSGWGWSKRRSFARALPEHWLYILILMIVLIDAAWRELSIGGHIVYFHFGQNLDFGCEILVAKPDLVLPITFLPRFWPDRLAKSRPIGLNARLINRARWELFKTLLIVLIVALLTEIGPIGCHGGCSSAGWQEGGGGWWMVDGGSFSMSWASFLRKDYRHSLLNGKRLRYLFYYFHESHSIKNQLTLFLKILYSRHASVCIQNHVPPDISWVVLVEGNWIVAH